jgi:hypothetical protein
MKPSIVGLFTAPTGGASMQSHLAVELIAGTGVLGDRYATKQGYWSDPRWPDQQLTLIEVETAESLGIDATDLRRNIVTREIRLDALIGVTFQIGDCLLLGVRRCDPCRHLDTLTRSGLADALGARGGLRAAILTSGWIAVGDRLCVSTPSVTTPATEACGTIERVPYNLVARGGPLIC